MARRKKTSPKTPAKKQNTWSSDIAFTLGKSAGIVSSKMKTASVSIEKNLGHARESIRKVLKKKKDLSKCANNRVRILPDMKDQLSPTLKELKAIADISGLTAALLEMDEISVRHSNHPVITQLVSKLKNISPEEQEKLSEKLIARLNASPYFNQAMYSMPAMTAKVQMTEEDWNKISVTLVECVSQTLEDIGLAPEERAVFEKLSSEIMKPLHDLIEFYRNPKTFSQKVKRLWRLQRIFMKTIKLMYHANAMASSMQNPKVVNPIQVTPMAITQ